MDDPRTTQALRELAELYLSPSPAQSPPKPDAAPAPSPSLRLTEQQIDPPRTAPPELLVAGHLPGSANLWISQYAQRLTHQFPTVVAMHLTEEEIALDLYGEPDSMQEQFITPVSNATLPEAINALAPFAPHWLLHIANPADAVAHAMAHQADQWTLLTGCDEAAVVAAYRLLKQLLDGRPDDAPAPTVRLMFLGCDEPEAQQAAQRLSRTAHEHMHLTPVLLGSQKQMLPVRRRRLGRYDLHLSDGDPAELIATLTHLPAPGTLAPGSQEKEPAPAPQAACGLANEETPPISESSALSSHLPALHPMQARCPRQPAVELALDDAGHLHLLGRDDPAAADIVAQLFAVNAWAVEHASLLALTVGDRKLDESAAPQLHIFTERAKHFGSLAYAGRPETPPVKLHLLLPVTVAAKTTWTCVELN